MSQDKLIAGSGSPRLERLIKLLSVATISCLSLLAVTTLPGQAAPTKVNADLKANASSNQTLASAYLYRLDPDSGTIITISLGPGSRPSDLSVVTGTLATKIWLSDVGLHRIRSVVYTSSVDYAITEYEVIGTPADLVATDQDVWFTLPDRNQVGHLDVTSGDISSFNMPTAQSDLADIALDSSGRVWVTERATDRLAALVISPSVVITEYVLPASGMLPQGIAAGENSFVWFATSATGYLWQLNPGSNEYRVSPPLGSSSFPYRVAQDSSNRVWATLRNANRLVRLTSSGPWLTTDFYTIPTSNTQPTAIAIDSLDRVFFVESSTAQIGRLVVTSTISFKEYSLAPADFALTALAVDPADNSVWAAAYRTKYKTYMPIVMKAYDSSLSVFGFQTYMPIVMNAYDSSPTVFGIQTYGDIGASSGFTRVIEANGKRVRFPLLWSQIEPTHTTPDNYQWNSLDTKLAFAGNANVNVILTLGSNPGWAAATPEGPVTNTEDLKQFMSAAVARYPQVEYWEFYNEPDSKKFFGFKAAAYANMLNAVYPVVKAANPNAKVVMGGLALDWFTTDGGPFDKNFLVDVLANCTGVCFDVGNFHYYPAFRSTWETYGHDIIGKFNFVTQTLAGHGYRRPIIVTESGWPSGSIWGSPELEARFVPKVYVRGLAAGLPVIIWYSLLDGDASDPGLLDQNLAPRPAYTAFKNIVSLMTYAQYVRTIPTSTTGSARIEGYQFAIPFSTGQKQLDVYWYDCPSMYTLALYVNGLPADCNSTAPLNLTASHVAMIDKLGNKVILNDADDGLVDGKITIPGGVGSSPIYIDYNP